MQKRKLGKNGPEVSALGLGCMGMSFGYGPPLDKQEMISLIRQPSSAASLSSTQPKFMGLSLTKNLWARPLSPFRGQVVIATKFGFDLDPGRDPRGMKGPPGLDSRPEHIRQAVEGSLKRLKVERSTSFTSIGLT